MVKWWQHAFGHRSHCEAAGGGGVQKGGLSGRHDLAAFFLEDLMLPIDAEDKVRPDVSTGPTV